MQKYWNAKINIFFLKLLKLDESTLFVFEWVFFDWKNIELRVFNKYFFLTEKIYLKSDNNKNLEFLYSWNSNELFNIVEKVNKEYKNKSFNNLYLIVLKNISNNLNIQLNHITSLLIWKNNYPELSFLLWNIHDWISNQTYNELMKFNFLEDYLSRRNERDSVDIQASICSLEHAEAECTYCDAQSLLEWNVNLFYDLWNNFQIDYSYYKPRKQYNYESYTTYLNQNETIVGWATDKIEEMFENIDCTKFDYIHVNLCCLPTIIWDDLGSIIKRYQKVIQIPIIYTNQTSINPYKILRELLAKIDISSDKEKHTCSFIWFPHQKWLFELKDILNEYWIVVKDVLLPIIEIDWLKDLGSVEKLVLIDTWRNEDAIKIFEEAHTNTFRTISPYGFKNSIKFIEQVLNEFNIDSNISSSFEDKIELFNSLKKENDYEVWFILLPNHLKTIIWNFRWLKIIDILSEMGFKINVFYYIDVNSSYKENIKVLLEKNIKKENLWDIILSTDKEDLNDFINNKNIDLYYSEIRNDNRILKYKKQIFSTSIFEVWVDGIIRSLEQLIKLWKLSRNINNNFK